RTPSVDKKTMVSWSDPTAALATTKPTVALSESFLALVMDTQNFPVPDILGLLLGLYIVRWMLLIDQRVAGEATPSRDVFRGTGIGCGQLQNISGSQLVTKLKLEFDDQFATAHIPGIPGRIRLGSIH